MAEIIKKATRESFGEALCELAKDNKDIVVFDADLAAATKTSIFQKEYADRFFDCGIAEGNMIGVAAGMAAAGKIPVAASFAMFATGRAFEQIRNSVAYPGLTLKSRAATRVFLPARTARLTSALRISALCARSRVW